MLHTVSIGRDGLVTTRLGFGTGGLLRIATRRERHNVLAAAFASGIRHFDTAPLYGLGESERALGELLRGRRGSVTVTTKFGLRVSRSAARFTGLQSVARRLVSLAPALRARLGKRSAALYAAPDFGVESVRAGLEQSLRALGTDYVDLFLAHECSPEALPSEELVDFLERLRRQGTIREFGTAASFERTCGVLPLRPGLANVCQFESGGHVDAIRKLGGRSAITHSAMARSAEGDPHQLLRAAVLENPDGVVLMQSRSVAHIEANVRAVT